MLTFYWNLFHSRNYSRKHPGLQNNAIPKSYHKCCTNCCDFGFEGRRWARNTLVVTVSGQKKNPNVFEGSFCPQSPATSWNSSHKAIPSSCKENRKISTEEIVQLCYLQWRRQNKTKVPLFCRTWMIHLLLHIFYFFSHSVRYSKHAIIYQSYNLQMSLLHWAQKN